MDIIALKLKDIKPYKRNAKKHTSEQIEQIKLSIQQFGLTRPLGVWGDNNILVYGHGTYEALKKLKCKEVPCVRLDYMSDDERRAYTLVDNQLTLNTGFDEDLLNMELAEIELDMSDFDLIFDDAEKDEDKVDLGYYGDERERTINYYNLYDVNLEDTAGKYQMPIVKPVNHIPTDLLSFNYMLSSDKYEKGIHFFVDDYQFERLWKNPYKYIDNLKKYDCVLTPDFSLYREMPVANQLWNVYRSRLIGYILQQNGLTVIPTLQWCDKASYEFCFDGLGQGGTVAISTIGVKQDETAKELFFKGMDKAMEILKPDCVINYGGDIGYQYSCKVIYIENHNAERLKKIHKGAYK